MQRLKGARGDQAIDGLRVDAKVGGRLADGETLPAVGTLARHATH
jgi:hypothetical protein